MKRRGTCTPSGGGGGEGKRNKHTTRTNTKKKTSPPVPPVLGTVATRTRRQKREIATKWKKPMSILITILSYADPETIRQACCVSKQFRDLIYHDPGMVTNRVVPLLEIRPSENTGDDDHEDRLGRLVQQLYHLQNKLQRYVTLRIIDADKFKCKDLRTIAPMTQQLRLNGIVSLEMVGECYNNGMMHVLSKILPNLQEINLSNTKFRSTVLSAIRQAYRVSKQFRDLIYNDPGVKNYRVIPLLAIHPSEDTGDEDRIDRLVQYLYHRQNKLRRYVTLSIIDPDKFKLHDLSTMETKLRLNRIVSLEMAGECYNNGVIIYYFLSKILPNLQEINLSNTDAGSRYNALSSLSNRCTRLEKVTWNNIGRSSEVSIDGADIQKATNLREIYMDESSFFTRAGKTLSDLVNRSDIFLFHECESKILERVSIRNAKWCGYGRTEDRYPIIIPQNALIKFVRNAPKSLRWFRSNLTTENMTMLRSERPEIELVN